MRKLSLTLFLLAGCNGQVPGPDGIAAGVLPAGCKQAIVVRKPADNGPVTLTAWEYSGGWKEALGPIPCTIGKSGFAPTEQKKEGDGRTPSGVFRIGMAFGAAKKVDTKLDYKCAGPDDFWCDDPDSPQYNRMSKGMPSAKSAEKLKQDAYKYAAVIEYNTDPVVPGAGSAIFLHVWGGPDKPTAGCVAVAEGEMMKLLGWLDKGKKPAIALNP